MFKAIAARDTARSKCPLSWEGFGFPSGFGSKHDNDSMTTKERVFWQRLFRLPLFQQMPSKEMWGWTMGTMLAMRPRVPEAIEADIETYDAVRMSYEKPNDFHFF